MRGRDSRWRRRRRGFRDLVAAIGALGASLLLTSVCATEWCWAFAGAGFIAFVVLTRQALTLWRIDELVFASHRAKPPDPSMAVSRREAWRT